MVTLFVHLFVSKSKKKIACDVLKRFKSAVVQWHVLLCSLMAYDLLTSRYTSMFLAFQVSSVMTSEWLNGGKDLLKLFVKIFPDLSRYVSGQEQMPMFRHGRAALPAPPSAGQEWQVLWELSCTSVSVLGQEMGEGGGRESSFTAVCFQLSLWARLIQTQN